MNTSNDIASQQTQKALRDKFNLFIGKINGMDFLEGFAQRLFVHSVAIHKMIDSLMEEHGLNIVGSNEHGDIKLSDFSDAVLQIIQFAVALENQITRAKEILNEI